MLKAQQSLSFFFYFLFSVLVLLLPEETKADAKILSCFQSGQQVHSYGRTIRRTSLGQYEPDDSNLLISYVWNIVPSTGLKLTQGF